MIGSPLNYFDANTGGRTGMFNLGAQIGALNSPVSGPTMAIKNVLERARSWTDRQNAMQMELEQKKQMFDYERKAKLAGVGTAGIEPRMIAKKDPMTGKVMISTVKFDPEKGYDEYSNFSPVTGLSAKQEFEDSMYKSILDEQGGESPIPGVPPTAPAARVPVVGPDGKKYSLPANQLGEAMKQGYKRI